MFYVYVLRSLKDKNLYIGYSGNLRQRFSQHNQGRVVSTKTRIPFDSVYYEAYAAKNDARHRENMLKRFSGSYNHLKKRIKNSIILFK